MKKIFYFLFFLFFLGCSNLNIDKIDCNSGDDCPKDTECIAHKCKLKEAVSKCTEDKNCNTNEFCNNGVCEKSEACNGVECGEHGSCESTGKNDYKCNCENGYINENENADSPCVMKDQCSNDSGCEFGKCNENGICECFAGFHFDETIRKCVINGNKCKREEANLSRCSGETLERCVKNENGTNENWGKWEKENSPNPNDSSLICGYNKNIAFWASVCSNNTDCGGESCEDSPNLTNRVCMLPDMCSNETACISNMGCVLSGEGNMNCIPDEQCSKGNFRCSPEGNIVEMCRKDIKSNKTGWDFMLDCNTLNNNGLNYSCQNDGNGLAYCKEGGGSGGCAGLSCGSHGVCAMSSNTGGNGNEAMPECFCDGNFGVMNNAPNCVTATGDCLTADTCGDFSYATCRDMDGTANGNYMCICKQGYIRENGDLNSKCVRDTN